VTLIRPAAPGDWEIARDLRLAALADAPDAFGSTLEEARRRDEATWRAWTNGSFVEGDATMLLAFDDGVPVGIVVGARLDRGDEGERPDEVQIWSMWVAPAARRRGVGRALLDAVVEWGRGIPGVTSFVLHVTEGNDAAERVYANAGFVLDPDAPEEALRPGSPLRMRTMRRPAAHDVAIEIRCLAAGDLDRVCAALTARPPEVHRRRLEAQDRGGFVYLIGWIDGVPAGFVGLGLHDDGSPDVVAESRGYAMVSDLLVEEPYRRRGLARALMRAVEELAQEARMPGVILDTGTDEAFAASRALYRSLGYVDQGGVYLGGWSDPDRPGVHVVDPLSLWRKPFD
jgi:GNAT superfamily N-acetyltransferase